MLTRREVLINGIKALAGVVVAGVAVESGVVAPLEMADNGRIPWADDGVFRSWSECPKGLLHVVEGGSVGIGTAGVRYYALGDHCLLPVVWEE